MHSRDEIVQFEISENSEIGLVATGSSIIIIPLSKSTQPEVILEQNQFLPAIKGKDLRGVRSGSFSLFKRLFVLWIKYLFLRRKWKF